METGKVVINLAGKLGRLRELLTGNNSELAQRIVLQWTRIYAAFIRRRFVAASRGNGVWEPLAPSTIARRRKGSSVILRDTGLLFSQLSPSFERVGHIAKAGSKFSALVDFGGTGTYPDGLTTSDVMSFHQTGGGRLPQRKILVEPPSDTREKMTESALKMVERYLNGGS